jgi:hypothetical protein
MVMRGDGGSVTFGLPGRGEALDLPAGVVHDGVVCLEAHQS